MESEQSEIIEEKQESQQAGAQDATIALEDAPPQAAPQAAEASKNELMAECKNILGENAVLLKEIKSSIEAREQYDSAKQKIINRLDEEVKTYRDNFIFQSQKPIFLDLILLYDDLKKLIDTIAKVDSWNREEVLRHLDVIMAELLEILYRRDIEPYQEHPERLDRRLHRTISTVKCDSEEENNKVVKIVRDGFMWNDKVFRSEEVIIAKNK